MDEFESPGSCFKSGKCSLKAANFYTENKPKGAEKIDENCPTLKNFKKYQEALKYKQDKYERIVKIGRDITIESKRIIFFLHTIDMPNEKSAVLNEAEKRLEELASNHFKKIAKELDGEDPYIYIKAFSCGMQEFMEAFIYFNYLKSEQFFHWDYYQKKLRYKLQNELADGKSNICEETTKHVQLDKEISTPLNPTDFILGLCDVSGEVMRKCINNLGSGQIQGCFETCDFVRNLYCGFNSAGLYRIKNMSQKASTLMQNLLKMEKICYNIQVRGSELPQHSLSNIEMLDE